MNVIEMTLSDEQHQWVDQLLQRWGAWVYSGRLEKRMSNMIARWMDAADPSRLIPERPMCSDEQGLLISQAVDRVLAIDKKAFGMVISYYAHGASKRAIASYYCQTAKPRKMTGRGGSGWRKPSLITCRREVDQVLDAALWLIYRELYIALNVQDNAIKMNKRTASYRYL